MLKKSVGLIILTEVPDVGLAAVLRERGRFNFDEEKPESWPGGCQVTVHGKLEHNETFLMGLRCGTEEGLGSRFFNRFWDGHKNMVEVFHLQTEDKEVITFAIKIDFSMLSLIRLSPESGSIRFIQPWEISYVHDLTDYSKEVGVPVRSIVAMFQDEIDAVGTAFDHFLKADDTSVSTQKAEA